MNENGGINVTDIIEYDEKKNLNPNIDPRLEEHPLPYAVWARHGIKGDQNSNSERYLLELLNESEFFQKKSGGKKFKAPLSEESGQCDAISDNYEIDFKLLISSSMARAKSNTELQTEQIMPGVYITSAAKGQSGHNYLGVKILKALRIYSYEDLINQQYLTDDSKIVADIKRLLNWIKSEKNLLVFIPSRLCFTENMAQNEKQQIITNALQYDVYKLFELRKHYKPYFETFLCTILEDDFVIFGDCGSKLTLLDVVSVNKCPTYLHLISLI